MTFLRRALRAALGVALAALTLVAIACAGFVTTMARDFSVPASAQQVTPPALTPARADRIQVAILLGSGGTVATDALGPYGVFAASDGFDVRTVSASREPVALSGGLATIPQATYADYADGRLPVPDLVVVPAITDPSGAGEVDLRSFIERTHADGARVMGVCAGARVLVETSVLDGRTATSFWSDLDGMRSSHPETTWVSGKRWVDDGDVLTTAGVSSGIAASLHVVQQLAGEDEAVRIADAVRYPHWEPTGSIDIPVNTVSLADYPYVLGATLPWGQPQYGLGLLPGTNEIDIAAAAELYGGAAFTAHVIPVAESAEITTEHGMTLLTTPVAEAGKLDRLIVPGATTAPTLTDQLPDVPVLLPAADAGDGDTSFDPILADIARTDGRATAMTAAKYIEYPLPALPAEEGSPVRVTLLAIGAVLLAVLVGLAPAGIRRRRGPSQNAA